MREDYIFFAKVKDGAKIPSKRVEDGAYDIYPCFDDGEILVHPNETVRIPCGIASAFTSEYVAILKERGSTGVLGIGQRAGVIDSGFRGEWICPITNHTNKTISIQKGADKIYEDDSIIVYPYSKAVCQALFLNVPSLRVAELRYDDLLQFRSERGSGMLGSSGK